MSFDYPIWHQFQDEAVIKILDRGGTIVDIGGGLRISPGKSNRVNEQRAKKFLPYLHPDTKFIVTDYTDHFNPDQIEDIHQLSFPDNSIDGLFCFAVMEHIHSPEKAADEIVRVLKPGGQAFLYVPFIFKYHAHPGHYSDYFRFTRDGINYLFRKCSKIQIENVCGVLETLIKLTPLSEVRIIRKIARYLDENIPRLKERSKYQTSGFNFLVTK